MSSIQSIIDTVDEPAEGIQLGAKRVLNILTKTFEDYRKEVVTLTKRADRLLETGAGDVIRKYFLDRKLVGTVAGWYVYEAIMKGHEQYSALKNRNLQDRPYSWMVGEFGYYGYDKENILLRMQFQRTYQLGDGGKYVEHWDYHERKERFVCHSPVELWYVKCMEENMVKYSDKS